MARPREFDEKLVLDRALEAFWARGYDATSVEDLVQATGLGRASLYGAFGDKEQLFRRVMDRYLERSRGEIDCVTHGLRGRAALEAFLRSRFVGAEKKSGCFLQIAATSGTSPPLVQGCLSVGTREVTELLQRLLAESLELKELPADADLSRLVSVLGVLISGLTASAKAGLPEAALEQSVQGTLQLIFGP